MVRKNIIGGLALGFRQTSAQVKDNVLRHAAMNAGLSFSSSEIETRLSTRLRTLFLRKHSASVMACCALVRQFTLRFVVVGTGSSITNSNKRNFRKSNLFFCKRNCTEHDFNITTTLSKLSSKLC